MSTVMRSSVVLFALCFSTIPLFAESASSLIHEKDEAKLSQGIEAALGNTAPLDRATAARVIAVRALTSFLPQLRAKVETESDATAAREFIRALALLGEEDDIHLAVKVASKWPPDMDEALAIAVARRKSGAGALNLYLSTLRNTRMKNTGEFFRVALWGRADLIPVAGSRLIGAGDEDAWRSLLAALKDSNVAMNGPILASSLTSPSEDIRSSSVWYLIRGYASQPDAIHEAVKATILEQKSELSSDRVDYALELLRRMLGAEKKDDPRWLRFLETADADDLFIGETAIHPYLTDAEYAARYARCEVQTRECAMPKEKPSRRTTTPIPSQQVAPLPFNLPTVLPAGLVDSILNETRCTEEWIGVVTVTLDPSGRVQSLDLAPLKTSDRCKRAIDTMLKLSMATNGSVRSPFTGPIILVRAERSPLCLDEDPPLSVGTATFRSGGAILEPKIIKRVEPQFPRSAREAMTGGRNVLVIVESVISRTGCVRSLRLLSQSPYPELNGAALLALSKWKFHPGQLDGKPVDVIFNLTVNFITR